MGMRIISAKDHGDSFRTLESGRAVAFMMDDALLAGEFMMDDALLAAGRRARQSQETG
ncbi:Glutamate Aspartate periplasmic binding protein precursor GltI [Salmonella enterica subsp. enterica serovar Wandsworth str. A4-580]|uniref:Glutamate Aspartate periplasmic binding protein GltI n=1 Tax=Salmonella enterica subsp. enterica serovar Wandsworth str. A4-580 TaxID=913086 RepID=G5S8E7_SALET|nr:Glutamate Aspartate periplasmic binding protein precursor GltI [Salmonella enterica subsp. enterica serovar Wandsworth str. A4-580]